MEKQDDTPTVAPTVAPTGGAVLTMESVPVWKMTYQRTDRDEAGAYQTITEMTGHVLAKTIEEACALGAAMLEGSGTTVIGAERLGRAWGVK